MLLEKNEAGVVSGGGPNEAAESSVIHKYPRTQPRDDWLRADHDIPTFLRMLECHKSGATPISGVPTRGWRYQEAG
jgi:hypothetical protein